MTKKIAVYATAAVAGLGLSACGGGAAGDKGGNSTTESISDTFNEANKLENELYQAVNRLIVDCMEEQDFDVHPRQLLELAPENEGYNPFDDAETPDSHNIPTVKDAKKEGFGFNLYLDPEYDGEGGHTTSSEGDPFYEKSDEYQREYVRAQYGDEYYDWAYRDKGGEGEPDGAAKPPLAAGCSGEVGKAVYGKPILPDPDEQDTPGTQDPHYGVDTPAAIKDWDGQEELYQTQELLDARDELAKCIETEGYPYFEYGKSGKGMGISDYADRFYQVNQGSEADGGDYDLPKDAPWADYDDAFAAEVAFATAVANCADDTGFRKTSEQAWVDAIEESMKEGEKEIYAWYEDIKAALEKAQNMIGK